jgi:spore coat polysaccharide biosynthesis protein SpsF
MATLQGEPMIMRQLERLRGARCLSKIIVATSTEAVDDALAGFLVSRGHTVHRGAGADILAASPAAPRRSARSATWSA